MTSIFTAYGEGRIVATENYGLGKKRYRVAGVGFDVWMDGAEISKTAGNPRDRAGDSWAESRDKGRRQHEQHDLDDWHPSDAYDFENRGSEDIYAPKSTEPTYDANGMADFGHDHYGAASFDFEPSQHTWDNHTTLPYNWRPQFPVEMFRDEQTISPDHEIDAEERLHSSDSRSGENREEDHPYPGPAKHLFAAHPGLPSHNGLEGDPHELHRDWMDRGEGYEHESPYWDHVKDARMHEDPTHPQYGAGSPPLAHPPQLEYDEPGNPDSIATLKRDTHHNNYVPGEGRHNRAAGLDDRYADIMPIVAHNDPVWQFRNDPYAAIEHYGAIDLSAGLDYETGLDQVDHVRYASKQLKEAKWRDVAQKAYRLKREGHVHVKAMDPSAIYATVQGDHGDYEVMILRGSAYSGLSPTGHKKQAIANWKCSCDWGKWAFKRKFTFVGRLCSHGYAAYLTQQGEHMADQHRKRRTAGITDDQGNPLEPGAKVTHLRSQPHHATGVVHDIGDRGVNVKWDTQKGGFAPAEPHHTWESPGDLRRHGYRTAAEDGDSDTASLADFKKWIKDNNGDHYDMDAADTYLQDQDEEPNRDDAEKIYEYILDHHSEHESRDYDVDGYHYDNDGILQDKPGKLVPHSVEVPELSDEDHHYFTDLGDDRKTTGPEQIMASKGQPLSNLDARYPLRTAMGEDKINEHHPDFAWHADDQEDFPKDGIVHFSNRTFVADENLLQHLRDLSQEEPDLGHMADHNQEVRNTVEELRDRGFDASPMVASLQRQAMWKRADLENGQDDVDPNDKNFGNTPPPQQHGPGWVDPSTFDAGGKGGHGPGWVDPNTYSGGGGQTPPPAVHTDMSGVETLGGSPSGAPTPANAAGATQPAPGGAAGPKPGPASGGIGPAGTPMKPGGATPQGETPTVGAGPTDAGGAGSYTVKPGDTLSGIAGGHPGTDLNALEKANASPMASGTNIGANPDLIHPGDVLKGIGGAAGSPAANKAPGAMGAPDEGALGVPKPLQPPGGGNTGLSGSSGKAPGSMGGSSESVLGLGKPITNAPLPKISAQHFAMQYFATEDDGNSSDEKKNSNGTTAPSLPSSVTNPGSPAGGGADPNKGNAYASPTGQQNSPGNPSWNAQHPGRSEVGPGQAPAANPGALKNLAPPVAGAPTGPIGPGGTGNDNPGGKAPAPPALPGMPGLPGMGGAMGGNPLLNALGLGHLGATDAERYAARYFEADGTLRSPDGGDWMDYPFAGSGPRRKDFHTTSEQYVEQNERTNQHDNWAIDQDGDIIKDWKPAQRPKQSSRRVADAGTGNAGYGNPGPMPGGAVVPAPAGEGGSFEEAAGGMGATPTMGSLSGMSTASRNFWADVEMTAGPHANSPTGYFGHGLHPGPSYDKGETGLGEEFDDQGQEQGDEGHEQHGHGGSHIPGLGGAGAAEGGEAAGVAEELAPLLLAARTNDGSDIVRQFQASGGGALAAGSGSFSDDGIAKAARRLLKTAGRHYSLAEQRELEDEGRPRAARNLGSLDLRGTHYEG